MTASPPPDPCATPSTGEPAPTPKPRKSGWLNLAVDYGPIVLFFVIYRYYSPGDDKNMIAEISAVVRSTIGFMVAAVIALIVSKTRLGHVSPMLWLSTALIVFFGGLTVWAQDQLYIQLKPTVIYLFFGAALLFAVARGKSLLKVLLDAAFEGLDDAGWLLLSRNWGLFFLLLAAMNEGFRHFLTFGGWLQAKLYVFLPLSFIFTFAHMPMLLRHGLGKQAEDEVLQHPPHE